MFIDKLNSSGDPMVEVTALTERALGTSMSVKRSESGRRELEEKRLTYPPTLAQAPIAKALMRI